MASSHDTLVLGAGIAGLAYAHALGGDVVVLEASRRAGGLITTEVTAHGHVELGPEALADDGGETADLLRELGLQPVPADPAAGKRYVLHERLGLVAVPADPLEFLTSPLLSARGRARALSEPWRRKGVALDGSVADFVRHRLGDEVLARLVDPFVSGIYAGDPERLSLAAAFPTLHALAAEHGSLLAGLKARARARRESGEPRRAPTLMTIEGGLQSLPDALARALGEKLVTGCRVHAVHAEAGGGFRVLAGDGERRARRVVLALPAARAAEVLAGSVPAAAAPLAEVQSESLVAVAHAWPREQVEHPLDGFGYLVPSSLGLRHLGTLFSSSIAPARWAGGQVLLRTLLGGARAPELLDLDDAALLALVTREVGDVLGLRGTAPAWSRVQRWKTVLPRYDLGHPERQARLDAALAAVPGLFVLGNHRRGISVNALVTNSRHLAHEHATTARRD